MRRLPKMAAALLAAALAVSAALPALAADQRAELELEASVRCTGEAADETLTVRLTALDGAPTVSYTHLMGNKDKYFEFTVQLTGEEGKTYQDSYAITGGSYDANPASMWMVSSSFR